MIFKRRYEGFTLTETMLVLAAACAILLLGLKWVSIYQIDTNVQRAQGDVDKLFSGMTLYYQMSCNGTQGVNNTFTKATLYPPGNAASVPIDLNNDLSGNGFLPATLSHINPILDNNASSSGNPTYVVQFNRYTGSEVPRTQCTQGSGPGNCTKSRNVGSSYIWEAQVAIQINPSLVSDGAAYLSRLGGDCLSTYNNNVVTPCSEVDTSKGQSGNYIVWERLPMVGRGTSMSRYWQINPTVKEFNQLYTTYQINYLLDKQGYTVPSSLPQYYLCGG